jgi:D-alanine-D-alanine ligase
MKLRVGVIFGGVSGEHEVSLVSATSVISALDSARYEVVPIGITPEGRWISSPRALNLLKSRGDLAGEPDRFLLPEPGRNMLTDGTRESSDDKKVDVVFPLVHGTFGEDGTLQGLLELADLPYVGAGVIVSALGMDKILQKKIFTQAGLPVANYAWFLSSTSREKLRSVVHEVEDVLVYPVFVKPANTGSSVGISKVHNRKELAPALGLASRFDRKVVVEQGIRNIREIEVSVLGNDAPVASVAGEVVPSNEFYDYDAKYVDGKSTIIIPADLPRKIVKQLQQLAVDAFRSLDCCGMARVDFFVTRRHKVYLNEINTIPGFTSISMYPKLWEASGLAYADLLDKLIQLAMERHKEKAGLSHRYTPTREWFKG